MEGGTSRHPSQRFVDSSADVESQLQWLAENGVQVSALARRPLLLTMATVVSRASGIDPAQLALALEEVLVHEIDSFGDGPFGVAALRLFGIGPAWYGQPLSVRRTGAADALSIKTDTFRRNYEGLILEELAVRLWAREVTCRQRHG